MAGADRAINMALRVQGIGDVERDFKRAGDAGEASFSRIEKAANGAAREVSDYHARLKRAALAARADAANLPEFSKGDALTAARARNRFVLDRVDAEKTRIRAGLPDMTLPGAAAGTREAGLFASALRGVGGAAGLAAIGLTAVTAGIGVSIVAFEEHEATLDKFNATLAFSGNQSDATARQIEDMARRTVDATQQSEEASLAAAASLARVPGITADMLEQALDASARFADAMGTDVSDTAQSTAEVLTKLAENDIKGLVQALDGKLDPALATAIVQLAQAGKTAEAQQAYLTALSDAAGDGPNGLARATDGLSDSWDRLKAKLGENFAGPAASMIDGLTWALDKAASSGGRLIDILARIASMRPGGLDPLNSVGAARAQVPVDPAQGTLFGGRAGVAQLLRGVGGSGGGSDAAEWRKLRDSILHPPRPKRTRSGGRGGGKSDAEREAERLAREAEAARNAADRIAESNDDVIESYRRRAAEANERLGLEGAALEAVERRQEIDAVVRRLSAEAIEKEVAARRAEAAVTKTAFDEAQATAEATAALEAKRDTLRGYAEQLVDAEAAQRRFTEQQEKAAAVFEATRTPIERIRREVEELTELLRGGLITPDSFDRRMQQLAEDMVDAAERGRNAWEGFGREVGGTLRNIVFNGGSALDVLQSLVSMTAERLFEQNIGNPIAQAIDGLTGNDHDKNVAAARAGLPNASAVAAGSVAALGTNADLAAAALGRLAGGPDLGAPIAALGSEADETAAAMRAAAAGTTQFGGALGQVLGSLIQAGAGGGGGGLIGSLLSIGGSVLGASLGGAGGGAASGPLRTESFGHEAGHLPGFAGGGLPPVGVPFDVGENGRERMILFPGGGGRVLHGEATRRLANDNGAPPVVANYFTIPERADPRRTATSVSRAVQGGIQRAQYKGLAAGPRRIGR